MSISKTMLSKAQAKSKSPEISIMERYSPLKFETIPSTSTKQKVNVFKSFRPKQSEVLDYSISETFLEMEHKGTQINYRETKAEYVPAPEEYLKKRQKRRRIVYSHGGPPQWKFVDEIWLEKQNQLQEIYKKEFKEFVENRKRRDEYKFAYKHALIQSLVGPDWYQELSPRQIKLIDHLHGSIQKDMRNNTICCTKEIMARLGLVCRVISKKIQLALEYCCGCPVEFLFILYQLLDPKRKYYSVNDRLILSSVVHLTMTQTLRELHIRIPSPVKKKAEKSCPPSIRKKEYDSPYLVPYTFKPAPQKFTGIYRKKHIQYPESPYFSYLELLKIERYMAQDYSELELRGFDEVERELIQETVVAQKLYNEMNNTEDTKLLKPSVLKLCGEFEEYKKELIKIKNHKGNKVKLPPLVEVEVNETQCTCPSETEIHKESVDENNYCICRTESKIPPPLSMFCTECSLTRKEKNVNSVIVGITIIECKEVVPILGGIYFDFNCSCPLQFEGEMELLELKKKFQRNKQKYLINGVVITNLGPIYSLSAALCSRKLKTLLKQPFIPNNNEKTSLIVNNNKGESFMSNGEKKSLMVTDNEENIPPEELNRPQEHWNGGEYCECGGEKESEKISSSSSESHLVNACHCSREIDNFLKNKCTCEMCNVEQRRKDATFILSGVKDCEHESNMNIVHGIQDRQCRCLENYLEKMKKVEEYRKRCKAVYELKKRGLKYAVSGVTNTEKGPVYQISGIRPPLECICKELFEEEEQLKEELRRIPKMPPTGRINFGIGGVKETSTENIFLINSALECGECPCEQLYKEFMTEHVSCWEAYQNFMTAVETSKMEYLTEYRNSDQIGDSPNMQESDEESVECLDLGPDDEVKNRISEVWKQKINDEGSYCDCLKSDSKKHNPEKLKAFKKLQKNNSKTEEKEKDCSCECNKSDSLKFDSSYAIKLDPINYQHKGEPKRELKRFIILRKIPCNIRAQRLILKEALEGLAADGFPLAKLPDAHKLPHFKLWMELRSGKKWTQEDRRYYDLFSKFAWTHTHICYQSIKVPRVTLSPEEKRKINWNQAEYFRNLTDNEKYNFHRKVKQQLIHKTREFFPTVFEYEFPTRQFRKCYFAYLPNKEEDAIINSTY